MSRGDGLARGASCLLELFGGDVREDVKPEARRQVAAMKLWEAITALTSRE